MKHTKGPWKTIVLDGEMWINPDRPSGEWALICRVNGRTVKGSTRPAEPNADRIVACVNGCDEAGITEPSALAELLANAPTHAPCDKPTKWLDDCGECKPCKYRVALRLLTT